MWKISIKSITISIILCSFFAFSCKKKPQITADVYLQKGLKHAKEKKFDSCVQELSKVDELYPYSPESKSGMPVLIYCHYMNKDYETIYPMIESFESLYPNSSQISYLYYLKALSYFRSIKNHRKSMNLVENLENTIFALYERDAGSEYSKNLLALLPFVEEMKANNRMYAVQYYISQEDWISAANRYTTLFSYNLNPESRAGAEKSFDGVLKNMGIKLENNN